MNTQKTVIEIGSHLSRRENPNDNDACEHRTSREAHRGKKY